MICHIVTLLGKIVRRCPLTVHLLIRAGTQIISICRPGYSLAVAINCLKVTHMHLSTWFHFESSKTTNHPANTDGRCYIYERSYFTIAFYMCILFQCFISPTPPTSTSLVEPDPTQRKGPMPNMQCLFPIIVSKLSTLDTNKNLGKASC